MEGRKVCQPFPLTNNTQNHMDDREKAEILASFYYTRIGIAPSFRLPQNIYNTNTLYSPGTLELIQPFTTAEATQARASLRPGKAVGHDLIHLTPDTQQDFLQIINTSWRTGEFSSCWKVSTLIPVFNPAKDLTLQSTYRPIGFLTCVGKLLVATRLSWWVEEKRLLKGEQLGFRPHRSTLDVLAQMDYYICHSYRQQQVMSALCVDL